MLKDRFAVLGTSSRGWLPCGHPRYQWKGLGFGERLPN